MELTIYILLGIVFASLVCEYMDASIGMGFGTTLAPILLLFGLNVLDVVPAVLIGQIAGGVTAGIFHYKLKNVEITKNSIDTKVILILTIFGIIGAISAVIFAINIPKIYLKLYIGIMITIIGIIILIKRSNIKFSWLGIIILAIISAFNKGVSGGGYGPLVTGGQLINGRETKNSVGSTTIAEIFVCLTAFILYSILQGHINWELSIATIIGASIAGPLSALTVTKLKDKNLKTIIGIVVIILGILTLIKIFI